MPHHPNTLALWAGKRIGNIADSTQRQEIEDRIRQRKPLRKADIAFLRDRLGMTTWIRNGKDVLA